MSRQIENAAYDKYYNPKSFVHKERYYRKLLQWAINTFDKEIGEEIRWLWYSTNFEPDDSHSFVGDKVYRSYAKLRKDVIPKLLGLYLGHKVITVDEVESLKLMLNSHDRSDWYMAFNIIKTFKKRKRIR